MPDSVSLIPIYIHLLPVNFLRSIATILCKMFCDNHMEVESCLAYINGTPDEILWSLKCTDVHF